MNSLGVILLFFNLLLAPLVMLAVRGVRGVVLAITLGWLILSPKAGLQLPGLPQFSKEYAVSYGALIGVLLFRGDMVRRFRPSPVDLIMLAFLFSASISSLSNGLGVWDACSEFYARLFVWGVPYFIGRALVRDLADVRQCAIGILLAGMIAVPFCLIEMRLSPQLHRWVYGDHASPFHMSMRMGAYRPTLMFRHGIEVGSWMACSSIIGLWLALGTPRDRLLTVPLKVHAAVILIVTVLCRSLGSLALLSGAVLVAAFTRTTRLRLALILLILAPPTYLTLRVSGAWTPALVADLTEQFVDAERAESFRARVYQEEELGAKAAQRPFFGWGGYNRFRVFDDYGEATTAVDALWLITYGKYGLFGLAGLYGTLCIPALIIVLRTPPRFLLHPNMGGVVGLILALMIATGDSLQNGFFSPLMTVASGVLATTAISIRHWLPRPARSPQGSLARPRDAGTPSRIS